jgi:hypothetical protein
MTRILLSCTRGGQEFGRRLSDDLTANGFDVSFPDASLVGDAWLEEARKCDRLLLVIGPGDFSECMRREWRLASDLQKEMLVLRLGNKIGIPEEVLPLPLLTVRDDQNHLSPLVDWLSGGPWGDWAMHYGPSDRVNFTVTSPAIVASGRSFTLDIWVHVSPERWKVVERARRAAYGSEIRIRSKGILEIAWGTVLTVRLKLEGLIVENAEDTILWVGEIANATFAVAVPDGYREGRTVGLATIHVDGMQIARIDFEIQVGREATTVDQIPAREHHHRKAFASYSSEDRNEVLGRIQGMHKVNPQLDVFLDVLKLRSGQRWQEELWNVIPASDIFYLFWSRHARQSEWVEKEWRCALEKRGQSFIDPCPLEPPDVAPPPPELKDTHFNDWHLWFMRPSGNAESDGLGVATSDLP